MTTFRYDLSGQWYKGNTHLHTTASDGGKTRAEVGALYAAAGYDFLFVTDHWRTPEALPGEATGPLLWLDGVELDGRDEAGRFFHIVCLGVKDGLRREMGLVAAVEAVEQQGALLILAHPFWTGTACGDSARFAFHGVEVYNHVVQWLNGKGDGRVFWHEMLARNPNTLAFAADDAHLRPQDPGWNGGWTVVNAPELTADAIMQSLRRGNYYASCGPEFGRIEADGTEVHVTTSPVQFVRLVGPGYYGKRLGGFGAEQLSEATFSVPPDWAFAYLEIEDRQGRRAWTNTLFTR